MKTFFSKFATYFRLVFQFVKYSVQSDMAYKANFISNVISSIGWTNYSLFTILVLGRVAQGFGGWSKEKMLLLVGSWMINNGLAFAFFYPSMKATVKDILNGNLDLVLTKPVDSQILTSVRRFLLNSFLGFLEGVAVVIVALIRLSWQFSLLNLAKFFFLTAMAVALYYCFWFIAVTLNIHLTNTDNLFYLVPELTEASKFPLSAYPKPFEYLFSSLIPVLLITTFPVEALLGVQSWLNFFYMLAVSFTFIFFTRKFWFWSLKRYASASS